MGAGGIGAGGGGGDINGSNAGSGGYGFAYIIGIAYNPTILSNKVFLKDYNNKLIYGSTTNLNHGMSFNNLTETRQWLAVLLDSIFNGGNAIMRRIGPPPDSNINEFYPIKVYSKTSNNQYYIQEPFTLYEKKSDYYLYTGSLGKDGQYFMVVQGAGGNGNAGDHDWLNKEGGSGGGGGGCVIAKFTLSSEAVNINYKITGGGDNSGKAYIMIFQGETEVFTIYGLKGNDAYMSGGDRAGGSGGGVNVYYRNSSGTMISDTSTLTRTINLPSGGTLTYEIIHWGSGANGSSSGNGGSTASYDKTINLSLNKHLGGVYTRTYNLKVGGYSGGAYKDNGGNQADNDSGGGGASYFGEGGAGA